MSKSRKQAIGKLWRESFTARMICAYPQMDRLLYGGEIGSRIREEHRTKIRRFVMRQKENSRLLRAERELGSFLLHTSLSSVGQYCMLSSFFCLTASAIRETLDFFDLRFAVCAMFLASSLLLLHSSQSVAGAIEKSRICNWLLFSVCGLTRDRFSEAARGVDRRWWALGLAVFTGILTVYIHPVYVLFSALLLIFLAIVQTKPELWMLFLLLALPLLNLWKHPTLILTVGVLTAEILWLFKALAGHRELRFGVVEVMILLFAGLHLLAGVKGIWRAILILSFFPMESMLVSRRYQRKAIYVFALSAGIAAAVGIWQYYFTEMELRWVDVSRFSDIGGRVTSVFSNPNILAVFLLLSFPITITAAMEPAFGVGKRIVAGAFAAIELVCLILTWSRGAWLGVMAQVLFFLVLHSASSIKLLLWGCFPSLVWLPLLPHSLRNRFSSIGSLQESSIRYRLYTWQSTWRMIRKNPLGIGVGEEAFLEAYRQVAISGTEGVPHTHNLFLQITVELGVQGLLCFFAVLLFLLYGACYCLTEMRSLRERTVVIGALCSLVGCLVMGLFDYVWYHGGMLWMFWAVVSLLGGVLQRRRRTEREGSVNVWR